MQGGTSFRSLFCQSFCREVHLPEGKSLMCASACTLRYRSMYAHIYVLCAHSTYEDAAQHAAISTYKINSHRSK